HGTRCAGEVAAVANNSVCGVGVAYDANIGGVRMLDGQATDVLEEVHLASSQNTSISTATAWGPKDDGKTFGKPGKLAQEALMQGALKGRGGKGNIYVWATGNGGLTDDDCNCDGYTTSIYTISVGCIGDHGLSAYYTELCSSTLGVTFNGGSHREKEENKMVTTDLHHKCTEEFKGTSSAASTAAGMFRLLFYSP
ncbi:PC3-like endoprotease variant B, partial [Desmophyllum pertusum]